MAFSVNIVRFEVTISCHSKAFPLGFSFHIFHFPLCCGCSTSLLLFLVFFMN